MQILTNSLILIFTTISFALSAQNNSSCGTIFPNEITEEYINQQSERKAFIKNFVDNPQKSVLKYLPLTIYNVGRADGSGKLDESIIQNEIALANERFAPSRIQFEVCGPIVNLHSDEFFTLSEFEYNVLARTHSNFNTINIYIVENIYAACGLVAYPNNSNSPFIVMQQSCMSNSSTLAHELGHYFKLYHTHNGGDELVDGSNCLRAGDFICDTPADPTLGYGSVDDNCLYFDDAADSNGDLYVPDARNIMSYSRKSCRDRFSPTQYAQIAFEGTTNRSYLHCENCHPGGNSYSDWIDKLTLANQEFFSGNDFGYTDYRHKLIHLSDQHNQEFKIDLGSSSETAYSINFVIWIDKNQNGTYEDFEQVYAKESITESLQGSFLSEDLEAGEFYDMRICASRSTIPNTLPTACGPNAYAEAEDYTLYIYEDETCNGFDGINFENEVWISKFQIGAHTINSGIGNYHLNDYPIELLPGNDYPFQIDFKYTQTSSATIEFYFDQNDEPENGQFSENTISQIWESNVGENSVNGTLQIPLDISTGNKTLRLKISESGSGGVGPCLSVSNGEVEDYVINIPCRTTPSNDNSSFQESMEGWNSWGNFSIEDNDDLVDCCAAIVSPGTGGFAESYFRMIQPGQFISVSALARINHYSEGWSGFGIKFFDANYNEISEQSIQVGVQEFKWHYINTIAPLESVWAYIWAWKDDNSASLIIDELAVSNNTCNNVQPSASIQYQSKEIYQADRIKIFFTERIEGLSLSDFKVTNANINVLKNEDDGHSYSLLLTPLAFGPVNIYLPKGSARTSSGQGNLAASLTLEYKEFPCVYDKLNSNYNFSQGTTNWNDWGNFSHNQEEGHHFGFIPPGIGGFGQSQKTQVEAGENITVICNAKISNWTGNGWSGFGLKYLDEQGNEISEESVQIVSEQYLKHFIHSVVPENAKAVYSWVWKSQESNYQLAVDELSISKSACDRSRPKVIFSYPYPDNEVAGEFQVDAYFNEKVYGLKYNNLRCDNCSNGFMTDEDQGYHYRFNVGPDEAGEIRIMLEEHKAYDNKGNSNEDSNELILNYDQSDLPDLDINGVVDHDQYFQHETLRYTFNVRNTGATPANNVVVKIPIPAGMGYVNSLSSVGAFQSWDGTWNIGTLWPDHAYQLDLNLIVLSEHEVLKVFAQVTHSDGGDPDSTPNNGACCNVLEDDEAVVTVYPYSGDPKLGKAFEPENKVWLTPSPAEYFVDLHYFGTEPEELQISISDWKGFVVKTFHHQAFYGEQSFRFEVWDLPSGFYFLQVKRKGKSDKTIKFIKIKN